MPARKLTVAEEFYIAAHCGRKTAKEIASDLGLGVRSVVAALKKLPSPEATPPEATPLEAPKKPRPKSGETKFAEYKGTTCMTQAQSTDDDEAGENPQGYNPRFFETIKTGIHVIDPKKPIR